MLDAYIIDRIRREREQIQRRKSQVPLYIENPDQVPEEPTNRRRQEQDKPDRGSVVVDFQL